MIKYLIEQGIINEFDLDKYCLECAIRVGFVDILKLLIDASTIHRNPTMLNPLLVDACLCGHFDIVVFLLQQGADVKAKNHRGLTPLNVTIITNNHGISKLLIKIIPIRKLQNVHFVDVSP